MARPFYPHEADDPDLDWLVSNFLYERPDYLPVEAGMLPLMLLPYNEDAPDVLEPPIPVVALDSEDELDSPAEPWDE